MTRTPGTISRAKPPEVGLDYSALRLEGTRLVQDMSGQIWTDYNYSDPGVTVLEQLCYALTELSYRARFPVEDLLASPATGRLPLWRQGLYPARAIMSVNPVTTADLRRLIVDRVPGVGNAWFTPLPTGEADGVSGLYRIAVLVPSQDPCCDDDGPDLDRILTRVLDCYGASRALCEDVKDACVLTPVPTYVTADVQLDDNTDPNTVLARLLFALGLHLAPEPKRMSLNEMLAAGRTTAEIFDGPLMLRGFIAADELTPLPNVVPINDLLQVMAETRGVLSVDGLSVRIEGNRGAFVPGDTFHVPDGSILWLVTEPRAGNFSIRLLRGDVVCHPSPARVRRLLERHWASQRRTYELWADYANHYRPPAGQSWDLAAYSSVQDQFPQVYGIGEYGLPAEATQMRHAEARQLKGYLMPFDQLMANYFSQLAFVRDLFSIRAGGDTTYAYQSLAPIVPHAAALLRPDYETGLAALVATTDPVIERQSAVLDLLLSLYAEGVPPPTHDACCGSGTEQPGAALLKAKQALLARMVPATRDRGRGFDYRHPGPTRGMAGLEIRCRIQLALLDATMGQDGPQVVTDPAEASFGRRLPREEGEAVARRFLPVDRIADDHEDAGWDGASPLSGQRVAAALLPRLADPGRYRIGLMHGDGRVLLICEDLTGTWWLLGEYRGAGEAIAMTDRLVRAAGGHRQHLYIVEWTLLRYALPLSGGDAADYNFRVSAVLAARWDETTNTAWRNQARAIVRENMPAHIAVEDLFLRHRGMRHFQRLHAAWVEALRSGSAERRAETSWNLQRFLQPASEAALSAKTPLSPSTGAPPPTPTGARPQSTPRAPTPTGPTPRAPTPPQPAALLPPPIPEPTTSEFLPPELTPPPPTPTPTPVSSADEIFVPTPAQALSRWQLRFPPPRAGLPTASPLPEPDITPPPPVEAALKRHWWQRGESKVSTSTTMPIPSPKPEPPATPAPSPVSSPLGPIAKRTWWHLWRSPAKPAVRPLPPTPASPEPMPSIIPAGPWASILPGSAQAAPPGVFGFDTDAKLTAAAAKAFFGAGFRFAIRYLTRNATQTTNDLTAAEAEDILKAGLALMAVQHVAPAGWVPTAAMGQEYGRYAVTNARMVGFPRGVCLWLDLEGILPGTATSDVSAYCDAWFGIVSNAGYVPGLYVGADSILSGEQLSVLKFQYYWQPSSAVPAIPVQGYCMVQSIGSDDILDGVAYDKDVVQADQLGNTPIWLAVVPEAQVALRDSTGKAAS